MRHSLSSHEKEEKIMRHSLKPEELPFMTPIPTKAMEKAVATIVLAFSTDPMARWSLPDPERYLTYFPDVVRAFSGDAFEQGTAYQIAGFAGAAVWLAPGCGPDQEALNAIMAEALPAPLQAEAVSIFEQMAQFHPNEPHWYLPLIGVDPIHQQKGYGSALLQPVLEECDRDGMTAYLESSNPVNIPFYERHGFRLMGEIREGSSPTLYPMRRGPAGKSRL